MAGWELWEKGGTEPLIRVFWDEGRMEPLYFGHAVTQLP